MMLIIQCLTCIDLFVLVHLTNKMFPSVGQDNMNFNQKESLGIFFISS